jgi:hypothetical protein
MLEGGLRSGVSNVSYTAVPSRNGKRKDGGVFRLVKAKGFQPEDYLKLIPYWYFNRI